MRSILWLLLVTRYLETVDVGIWGIFVLISVVVIMYVGSLLCVGRC